MMVSSNENNNRDLVAISIEKSLIKFGLPVLMEVVAMLKKEYNYKLSDCFEHPEYLNNTLKSLYGKGHSKIAESIKKDLEEFSSSKSIHDFLGTIAK